MEKLIKNVRFNYQYRDTANFKQYGSVIFSNPNQLSIETIEEQLKEVLIDQEYFIPKACEVPLIYRFPFDSELDHEWYEMDSVEETNKLITDNRNIELFIKDCADGNLHAK
ncbi:hypothetical protein [Cytophaga aurantiaca]|uniref:hypothetical protein n=1 Tax=Cytophaga aurantiaca TaxID=29530 RepID=UPI00035D96E7|nr:hypothetical protein [Cytophaga aurantiaca]